jgi:carboxypeptidase C (cathepsin A)
MNRLHLRRSSLRRIAGWIAWCALGFCYQGHAALQVPSRSDGSDGPKFTTADPGVPFNVEPQTTLGKVLIDGRRFDYRAVAGALTVHPKAWDDAAASKPGAPLEPEASIFYVAYFLAGGADPAQRPVTFLFNGGPGSSTIWLHMGAFGPRRVVTLDDTHTPAAPNMLVNNEFSLLDASDLVFIDAPGTGFSRLRGTDAEKAFYGVDQDAQAFASFITQFLAKYDRWNSPKYLFGESYGTTRAAALANVLETEQSIDLNGIMLMSQILNFDGRNDDERFNPGVDLPYELVLPTYAAIAWYHHKLPDSSANLPALLEEVEHFAMTDYAVALLAGSRATQQERHNIALRLHRYMSLPVEYIEQSDLRVAGAQFQQRLLNSTAETVGRLDARYKGPTLDPLNKDAQYDPARAAAQSAYVGTFNDYVRRELKYRPGFEYKVVGDFDPVWDFRHRPPGASVVLPRTTNVMPDLANAMLYNPRLRIQVHLGYYDLATPFYEGVYEMEHLAIPPGLRGNIEFCFYEAGHKVYAHQSSLKALHERATAFILRTAITRNP